MTDKMRSKRNTVYKTRSYKRELGWLSGHTLWDKSMENVLIHIDKGDADHFKSFYRKLGWHAALIKEVNKNNA